MLNEDIKPLRFLLWSLWGNPADRQRNQQLNLSLSESVAGQNVLANCLKKPWITLFFPKNASVQNKACFSMECSRKQFHPFHTWRTPAQVFCYAICQPVFVRCQAWDELWRRNLIIMILFDVTGLIRIDLLTQSWTFNWRPAAVFTSKLVSQHPPFSLMC